MQYKVDTIINGELKNRIVFKTRTNAQKHILANYNAFSNDERFYVRFVHYSNWGKYKRPYHEMTIDSMNVQTKNLNICIELSPI